MHDSKDKMALTKTQKESIKNEIKESLCYEREIMRIIIFGSFVNSDEPNDIDVAVFQNSNQQYLPLSLKYRRLTRKIARKVSLDIFPVKMGVKKSFVAEIESGEIIYERRS